MCAWWYTILELQTVFFFSFLYVLTHNTLSVLSFRICTIHIQYFTLYITTISNQKKRYFKSLYKNISDNNEIYANIE